MRETCLTTICSYVLESPFFACCFGAIGLVEVVSWGTAQAGAVVGG
jgi:hypothetical protein